jgi:hypothetical protein
VLSLASPRGWTVAAVHSSSASFIMGSTRSRVNDVTRNGLHCPRYKIVYGLGSDEAVPFSVLPLTGPGIVPLFAVALPGVAPGCVVLHTTPVQGW